MRLTPLRAENRTLRGNLRQQRQVGIGRFLTLLQVGRCNVAPPYAKSNVLVAVVFVIFVAACLIEAGKLFPAIFPFFQYGEHLVPFKQRPSLLGIVCHQQISELREAVAYFPSHWQDMMKNDTPTRPST
ncbi:hypothetical protein EI94DRAFT_1828042 [Lactarius quietus]|nr:hypothetical protein EI94DRAFT_1828042 [Lactarius quietus]